MNYRYLGSTGLPVSQLSFGSYLTFGHCVDVRDAKNLMQIAYESGINLFDNAEVYAVGRSEEIMGESLQSLEWPRDTFILMTKVFWGGARQTQLGLHRKHLIEGCHAALKRLKVDYIDLFLCHRPDHNTPIEEIVRGMSLLIQQGKILYWGTSEWSLIEITEAIYIAKQFNLTPPSLEQFHYNMLERQRGEEHMLPLLKNRFGAIITMPIAGGILTGKYNLMIPENSRFSRLPGGIHNHISPEKWKIMVMKLDKIAKISKQRELTMAQLAIAWCLKNTNFASVIVGASNEQQLKENIASLNYLDKIDDEIMYEIDNILGNKPIVENVMFDYNEMIKQKYV